MQAVHFCMEGDGAVCVTIYIFQLTGVCHTPHTILVRQHNARMHGI